MAYALAKENEDFIERMVRLGRFNNQSEVVREGPCGEWSERRPPILIRLPCQKRTHSGFTPPIPQMTSGSLLWLALA
jgi:hypothetical protein